MDINRIKLAPGDHDPILRKWMQFRVGAIPSEPGLIDLYFRSANSLATSEIERIWIPFIVFENTEDNEATV